MATASRYQAVKQGGPFEIVPASKPQVEKGEVLINIKAVAVNPIDFKQLDYGFYVPRWPATLGADGAGVVEDVGEDVQTFKKGDEVLARFTSCDDRRAAFQNFAATNASEVTSKPESWSFEDAASLPTAYLTAACAVYKELQIPLPFLKDGRQEGFKPECILVLGGSSSVGATAIQLLRLALPNAQIIATSSPKHHELLKSHGASDAIDYKSSNLVELIKKVSRSGKGVEAILDVVNSVALERSLFDVLVEPKEFAEVATGQNVKDIPSDVKHHMVINFAALKAPGGLNLFSALGGLIEEGKFKLPVPVTVVGKGFDAIGEGIDTLRKGVSATKLVITL